MRSDDRALSGESFGEPVEVPWADAVADFHCFGCSPHNPSGLRLNLFTHPRGLEARFRLGRRFESYPGLVHGGATSAVCDETMGNLIALTSRRPVFTVAMRLRYVAPLAIDTEYRCVARIPAADRRYHACCEVLDGQGDLLASATATFQPVDMDRARSHMKLSDQESDRFVRSLTDWRSADGCHHP